MQSNNWKENAGAQKLLIETGRRLFPVEKYPKDLDFSKTISGTTYEAGT